MYCSNCGQRNDKQTRLCPACGAELQIMTDEHVIQEGLTTETTMQYAGFWKRIGAGIIDICLGSNK